MKREEVLNKQIQENSILIENIVYEITNEYTRGLDEIMITCRKIFSVGPKVTDEELED